MALRPIALFAIALIAMLLIVHFVSWGALTWLQSDKEAENLQAFPAQSMAFPNANVPPDPRLEPEPSHNVLPRGDLLENRAREQALIGPQAWSWVDSSHQFARIPLDQAMKLAVEHGLPDTLPATQPTTQQFMPPASALHGPGGVP